MQPRWTEYEGKRILYADYRDAKNNEEMIETLNVVYKLIAENNKPYLCICNFEGTYGTKEFLAKANDLGKEYSHLVIKQAMIGVEGVKKIFFNAYNLFTGQSNNKIFDDEKKAMDWLIS